MQSTTTIPPACLLCSPAFRSPHGAIFRNFADRRGQLNRGESEHERSGLSFRSSSPAAIRRSAAHRAGFGLQNLLSIRLEVSGCQSDDRFQDFSSSTATGQRAGGWPASHVHVANLRGSAVNMTRKPCLTENGARKNDIGAPPGDRAAKLSSLSVGDDRLISRMRQFSGSLRMMLSQLSGFPPLNSWHLRSHLLASGRCRFQS
ncbi:hypothetical protein TAL182_PB00142 (plasmid) [Rhizobium sp. TAL182]|nr:hypothetical protein TAL182_PB00142 [Rhizobium sp. TAL182]